MAVKFRMAGKLNEDVDFEGLEECVKRAAENCPAQVIQVGPPAVGLDPVLMRMMKDAYL